VHHQHELAVRRRQQEPLRAAFDAERLAFERRERRIDRLERRDVRRAGALDGRRRDERVELTAPRLDFGQLGQRRLLAPG
jgi:hypothetical protein